MKQIENGEIPKMGKLPPNDDGLLMLFWVLSISLCVCVELALLAQTAKSPDFGHGPTHYCTAPDSSGGNGDEGIFFGMTENGIAIQNRMQGN